MANKTAYPNATDDIYIEKPHDLNIWMQALRYIYAYIGKGLDPTKAFNLVTQKWDAMDQRDFKTWKTYYESGQGSAYKKADLEKKAQYFPDFLDVNDLKAAIPGTQTNFPGEDEEMEILRPVVNKQTEKQKVEEQERLERELIAQQVRALIGRLNSAERIATTEGIAKALGPSFENWVRALHELKQELQVAPFRTAKSCLMTDLIVRKGNQLYSSGDKKSANVMYILAQVAPPPLDPVNPSPDGSDAANPTSLITPEPSNEPVPTDTPTDAPPESNIPPVAPDENKDDAWVKEFLDNLNGKVDDKNEIMDSTADLYVDENDLKVYGQEAPISPTPDVPLTTPETPGADITEAIPSPEGNKLEQALAGTTVDDVIAKLDAISNIFKNREVPRQLAMVDIMMDQLGISSYFSELAEATAKALESNQYCSTRVEDVLARLKGGVIVPVEHAVDLHGEKPGGAEGNAVGLKNQLEQEHQKEVARKKNREDIQNKTEDAQIANPQAPVPEAVNTDALNAPTQVQAPNPGIRP